MKAGFCVAKIIRGFYMPRLFNAQAKTRSLLVQKRMPETDDRKEREKEREGEMTTGVG